MRIPTLPQAKELLTEAEQRNPGPWVAHSEYVGQAAQLIARAHPTLDEEPALILGLLHDIGRREGRNGKRHIVDGYTFLFDLGFDDAARICLTHSFKVKELDSMLGKGDLSDSESAFVTKFLSQIEFTDYDHLIQLCDGLAMHSGFCLLEKRMLDANLRLGVNEYTIPRWKAAFQIKRDLEEAIGTNIYSLLPGIVENTFDFAPPK